jgi:ribosomal protein S18 acetylase RimI-like enzyme
VRLLDEDVEAVRFTTAVEFDVLDLARGLSPDSLSALASLEAETVSADGGRLKLESRTLQARSGDEVEDVLWWDEGRLVGFVGLYAFGGPAVEVAGMVHPDYRRQGIGTRLLDEAIELCRGRSERQLLLVAPRTSIGARVLAESRGGALEHSEHALDLDGAVTEGPSDKFIILRPASGRDIPELARILADAFGQPARPMDADALGESTLVAQRDGSVIATLALSRSPERWDIYGFAVEPHLQGAGIGRDILRRVCRQANDAGVTRLHLEVEVNNDRALGLYTSLGFERTSTEDYFDIPI